MKNNRQEWENNTLEDYIEAMIRYSGDINGYCGNINSPVNANIANWKVFADIMRGAVIYE